MEFSFIDGPHSFYITASYLFALGSLATLLIFSTVRYIHYKKQVNKK